MAARMKKRVQLTELAPRRSVVQISIGEIEIGKLGAGELARLFLRYPALRQVGSGKISAKNLAGAAPEAVPEIIAMATGDGDDGILGARSLDAGDQLLILSEVFKILFPQGLAGFFAQVAAAMKALSPQPDPATPSV